MVSRQNALLCAVLAGVLLLHVAQAYVPADATRYANGMNVPGVKIADKPEYSIRNWTGQWNASIWLNSKADLTTFTRHRCNGTTWGAACNQPPLKQDSGLTIRVNFSRSSNKTLTTYAAWPAKYIVVRLDIAVATAADRGWRKKNGLYPGYGQHVLEKSTKFPADTTAGHYDFVLAEMDELPSVVLYPEVCVVCTKPDGDEEYCQCDRWNVGATAQTVEAEAIMGITPGMRAAAIVLSIVSPVFFLAYWAADNLYYKRTGRPMILYWN